MRSWLLSAAAVVLLSSNASAQEGPPPPPTAGATDSASTIDDDARFEWLAAEIAEIEKPTERWFTGWTWGFAWLTASQISLAAAAPTSGLRADSGVGAVVAGLGLAATISQPNSMLNAQETLRKYDASTPLGRYERRRRAEYILQSTASEERFEHSFIPFVLATVVNGAATYILVHDYGQDLAGWLSCAAGEVVTLIQIFSRPYSATRAWERYTKGYHPFPPSQVPPDQIELPDKLHLSFVVSPGGAGARITF
jgi:hypothetical protein